MSIFVFWSFELSIPCGPRIATKQSDPLAVERNTSVCKTDPQRESLRSSAI